MAPRRLSPPHPVANATLSEAEQRWLLRVAELRELVGEMAEEGHDALRLQRRIDLLERDVAQVIDLRRPRRDGTCG